MLKASGLQFFYGQHHRLKEVGFMLNPGESIGLFGHNGSGKSTLLNMLSGVLPIEHGALHYWGHEAVDQAGFIKRELRNSLGVLFQSTSSDDKLSSQQNLFFAARLMGIKKSKAEQRVLAILHQADLTDRACEPIKKFSGGMRRRLELYRTFLHQPKLLLLDEPTAGLDVKESLKFLFFLRQYQKETNAAVILATHNPEEVMLCDRVLMLHSGEVIANGPPKAMLAELNYVRCTVTLRGQEASNDLADMPWFDVRRDYDEGSIEAKIKNTAVTDFLKHPFLLSPLVKGFTVKNPSLADAYEGLRHNP